MEVSPLHKFILTLNTSPKPNIQWGSTLHGLLMSILPQPWPELLHATATSSPLSQWVEVVDSHTFKWHIQSLNDELGQVIAEAISRQERLYSTRLRTEFPVTDAQATYKTIFEFMDDLASEAVDRKRMSIILKTPAVHKLEQQSIIFPSIELVGYSLQRKICSVCPDLTYSDPEMMAEILSCASINNYHLHSATYGLNHAYMLGYQGYMEIHFHGAPELRTLAYILFHFSEWCGIGAKTALGMGGCLIG